MTLYSNLLSTPTRRPRSCVPKQMATSGPAPGATTATRCERAIVSGPHLRDGLGIRVAGPRVQIAQRPSLAQRWRKATTPPRSQKTTRCSRTSGKRLPNGWNVSLTTIAVRFLRLPKHSIATSNDATFAVVARITQDSNLSSIPTRRPPSWVPGPVPTEWTDFLTYDSDQVIERAVVPRSDLRDLRARVALQL